MRFLVCYRFLTATDYCCRRKLEKRSWLERQRGQPSELPRRELPSGLSNQPVSLRRRSSGRLQGIGAVLICPIQVGHVLTGIAGRISNQQRAGTARRLVNRKSINQVTGRQRSCHL